MEFINDIFTLNPVKNFNIQLEGVKLPSSQDVFFKTKRKEIFEQYESARIFLREIDTKDWKHWFTCKDTEYQEVFELTFKSIMFETALMYYNIIVDLTWTLCFVSAEYVIYSKDKAINIPEMLPVEQAYDILRKAENSVTNPNTEGNPFEYLKVMCPQFTESIDLIIDFWKDFSSNNIRNLYNFIKHKGKPSYEEIESFRNTRVMKLIIQNTEYSTDMRDVMRKINLYNSIKELKNFDDNILFPYVKMLFEKLELAINPSPFVF